MTVFFYKTLEKYKIYSINNIHIVYFLDDVIKTYEDETISINNIITKINNYRKFFNAEMWIITDKNKSNNELFYPNFYTAFKVKKIFKALETISYMKDKILSKPNH